MKRVFHFFKKKKIRNTKTFLHKVFYYRIVPTGLHLMVSVETLKDPRLKIKLREIH